MSELIIYEAAEKELRLCSKPETNTSLENLQRTVIALEAEHQELYKERSRIKSKVEKHQTIKANVVAINREFSRHKEISQEK